MSQVIDKLGLEGHDSELFSFLEEDRVDELKSHPSAETPLWTFGKMADVLQSVTLWNTRPGCLAFTQQPAVVFASSQANDPWIRYRGFSTNDLLIQVRALVLIRHLFVQGYTCALDDRQWIDTPADRGLERLRFIRGREPKNLNLWACMKDDFYWWAFRALDQVPTALGVARLDSMVDRCIEHRPAT